MTQRASTLKTVLFCTTRNIISCLTFFPDNNLVYSCKKTSTSHILKARCRTQARSQRWRRLRRLPDALNQAISHPCSFCIKEQQPCLWASRGLTLLLCPVSLSHQMYLPHKNCHIKNYTCIRGVMLEARAIFTHELLENQSTVLFLCSPTSCHCPALNRWTATKLLQQPEGTWT